MSSNRIIQICGGIAFVLFAAASFGDIKDLWGINFLKFLPIQWTVLAVLSVLIFLIPKFSDSAANKLKTIGAKLLENKTRLYIGGSMFSVLMFLLFLNYASSSVLLGDGSLRANQIQSPLWWLPTEMLDFMLHAAVYRFVFKPLELEANLTYQIISALSGILFIIGAFKLSTYLNPKKWLLNFLIICSSGIIVLFFGYIESYSIAAALIPFVMLSGLKAVDGAGSVLNFVLLFVLAGLFHSVNGLIFVFPVLFVLLAAKFNAKQFPKKLSKALAVALVAMIMALYVGRIFSVGPLEKFLLGLTPSEQNGQGILTVHHWLNILNWLLIAALPALVLVPPLLVRTETGASQNFRMHFLIWCIIPPIIFMMVFTPQLGGPKDWDLFALPAFTLLLAVLSLIHTKFQEGLSSKILPAILISFWIVIEFTAVNSSPVKSADRQEEIIEWHRFKSMFSEYANLYFHAQKHPELAERCFGYARMAGSERPGMRKEWVDILNSTARMALEKNDSATAIESIYLAIKNDTANLYGHLLLINYYNQFETLEKVMDAARLLARRFPDRIDALGALGILYSQLDSLDKAEEYYSRAFQIDSSRLDIIINLGVVLHDRKKPNESIEILRRGLIDNADNFLVNSNLTRAYYQAGNLDSARVYYKKARELAKSMNELQAAAQLQTMIAQPIEKNSSSKK